MVKSTDGDRHRDIPFCEAFAAVPGPQCTAVRKGVTSAPRGDILIILHQQQSCPGHIGRWLARRGHRLDIRRPRFGDPLPGTLANHAGAVVFGGPMSVNDRDDFIRRETEWIGVALKEQKPLLGICLGAQMLARHLGSTVAAHPEDAVEIGYHPIRPTEHVADGGAWPTRVYQWHREGFEVPHGGRVLATADGAFRNQAFSYGPAAVGLQFHPEITCSIMRRWTAQNREGMAEAGMWPRHLVEHVRHAPAVRAWLDRFLSAWIAGRAVPA